MNLAFPVQKVLSQKKFSQWYTGGDQYNLALGARGGAAGVTVGLGAVSVLCFTVVFCPVALAAGVYGGRKLLSKLGKVRISFFTLMEQNYDGSNYVQSFRFLNKKRAKKLQKELIKLSSLQMGEVKVINN